MSLEEAFARVVGRPAAQHELQRLHRLRDALGLRDNDAFWSIVMALEYYDSFFRQYPAQLAEQTGRCIESARVAFSAVADKEAVRVQRLLTEKAAETRAALAPRFPVRPLRLSQVTTALAMVVLFGALCVCAGDHMATPERPPWMLPKPDLPVAERGLAMVLALPAGWMIFALLLPAAESHFQDKT